MRRHNKNEHNMWDIRWQTSCGKQKLFCIYYTNKLYFIVFIWFVETFNWIKINKWKNQINSGLIVGVKWVESNGWEIRGFVSEWINP